MTEMPQEIEDDLKRLENCYAWHVAAACRQIVERALGLPNCAPGEPTAAEIVGALEACTEVSRFEGCGWVAIYKDDPPDYHQGETAREALASVVGAMRDEEAAR